MFPLHVPFVFDQVSSSIQTSNLAFYVEDWMSISIAKPSAPSESLELMPLEWMELQRRSELMRLRTPLQRHQKNLLLVAVVVVVVVVVVVAVLNKMNVSTSTLAVVSECHFTKGSIFITSCRLRAHPQQMREIAIHDSYVNPSQTSHAVGLFRPTQCVIPTHPTNKYEQLLFRY